MMKLFNFEPFHIQPGSAPIVVGAPHHGTRPYVKADRGTGSIALALAEQLGGRAVVVNDLRRIADVNKNPLTMGWLARPYAIRYQNELFTQQPNLVIEVHGHVNGRYAVEITTGFDLNPDIPADAHHLAQLVSLKQSLPGLIASHTGQNPTVGIYPLDRDVVKTATNTFTFQKIRRARQLAGVSWYGLHIELSAELRTSPQAQSAVFTHSLASAFATAIQTAFNDSSPPAPDSRSFVLIVPRSLRAVQVPKQWGGTAVAVVHPDELAALGALDGDAVLVRHGEEEVRATLTPSRLIAPGRVALPASLRRQISLEQDEVVTIGRFALLPAGDKNGRQGGGSLVIGQVYEGRSTHVWLNPADAHQLSLAVDDPLIIQGQPKRPATNSVTLQVAPVLSPRTAAVSSSLMDKLTLTLGEVITLKPCQG